MNALFVIAPYRYEGLWVFDDARVGLNKEPFVAGADAMIDFITRDIPNAQDGFRLIFAATPFPDFGAKLERTREEFGGHWYRWDEANLEGWLCPALFQYFEAAPDEIYVRAEARGSATS